jgi:tRNA dimethylallyltransferase
VAGVVSPSAEPLLVVLLGPTASGKTALSLTLAEQFDGEVVSCDSVAVYRGLEIGTAKPTRAERERFRHHMIDIYTPDQASTAGDYARQAREVIHGIAGRGRLPIVTGGTGLYLRAVIDGLFAGPQRSEALRIRLNRSGKHHGRGWLHRMLTRLDAASAQRIHSNDTPKLIRAIEVSLLAQKPMSEAWKESREPLGGFKILRIGLEPDRNALYARINERAARMFDEGLLDEIGRLIEVYGESPVPFDSLGYRQARAVLRGEMSREEAIAAAQQGHRNYAKRQQTWFRREPNVHWLKGFGDEPEVVSRAMTLLSGELRRARNEEADHSAANS